MDTLGLHVSWFPSWTQAGLILSFLGAWAMAAHQAGSRWAKSLEEYLRKLDPSPGLGKLRRWSRGRSLGARSSKIAYHSLGLILASAAIVRFAPEGLRNLAALFARIPGTHSLAQAAEASGSWVGPETFAVSFLLTFLGLSSLVFARSRIQGRAKRILGVATLLAALPMLSVVWLVFLSLASVYAFAVLLAPYSTWVLLFPFHFSRTVQDSDEEGLPLSAWGFAFITYGFVLQFVGTL